ncbi:MAG TPA: hypothetical protein VG253_06340 [Streptosporangiaceae bacterium]|nr:hypothetical protein [Streptosporangiaceae bacterium]
MTQSDTSKSDAGTPDARPTLLARLKKLLARFKNFWKALTTPADFSSSVLVLVVIVLAGLIWIVFLPPSAQPTSSPALTQHRPTSTSCRSVRSERLPVKVGIATGPGSTMNIYIDRNGVPQKGQSVLLTIQRGRLCPNTILSTAASDFAQTGGQSLRMNQIATWASVDKSGTHVVVHVAVAPRHKEVSGFGAFSGIVRLDSHLARGGSVAVRVYVQYTYIDRVFALSCLAAFAGFSWAWLVHGGRKRSHLLRNLILRIAVVLTAVPIASAKVLANPNWQGTLGQYVALGTFAGAAAIAATPTLRVLILPKSRAKPSAGQ